MGEVLYGKLTCNIMYRIKSIYYTHMLDTNNHICTQSLNKIDVQKNRVSAYSRIVSRLLFFLTWINSNCILIVSQIKLMCSKLGHVRPWIYHHKSRYISARPLDYNSRSFKFNSLNQSREVSLSCRYQVWHRTSVFIRNLMLGMAKKTSH